MKEKFSILRFVISIAILAIGIAGFILMGTPEVQTRPPARKNNRVVQTVTLAPHTDGIQFQVDGVVVPFRQVNIAAQVAGRVEFKADQCRLGQTVKKGELLFRIDQGDYQLEVARLEEEVKQASSMLEELDAETASANNQIASAKSQLKMDARQVERSRTLLDRRAASETELDNSRRAELSTRSSLQKLMDDNVLLTRRRTRLESAMALQETNLEKAQVALLRTEIVAPMDGVVVSENVQQDGYVQSGSTVVRIQDTSQVDVTCKLHMRQLNWLWQGASGAASESTAAAYDFPKTPATIVYELGPTKYQWSGVVNRFDGAGIDNQTRMVPCRVNVESKAGMVAKPVVDDSKTVSGESTAAPSLLTGMFVKVVIDAQPPIPLLRIPQRAIQPGNAVWTVADGKLKRKTVRIANSTDAFVIAYQDEAGLMAGDVVVVSPMATPVEGAEVEDIGDTDPATIKPPAPPSRWGGKPGGGKPGAGKPGAGKPGAGKPAGKTVPQ